MYLAKGTTLCFLKGLENIKRVPFLFLFVLVILANYWKMAVQLKARHFDRLYFYFLLISKTFFKHMGYLLFSFQIFGYFPDIFLLLISKLTTLLQKSFVWLELFNLLKLVLSHWIWSILVNVSLVFLLLGGLFYKCHRSVWLIVLFKPSQPCWFFYLLVLSGEREREMLN